MMEARENADDRRTSARQTLKFVDVVVENRHQFYVSQLDCPYNENKKNVSYTYKVVLYFHAERVKIIKDHMVIFVPLFPVDLILLD